MRLLEIATILLPLVGAWLLLAKTWEMYEQTRVHKHPDITETILLVMVTVTVTSGTLLSIQWLVAQ